MLVNTNNVALVRAESEGQTGIILRDGSEYTIKMKFDDFAMKINNNDPVGLA